MSKFALTVNEIRQEIGKPALPGCDDLILSQEYLTWYDKYSKKGQELMEKQAELGIGVGGEGGAPGGGPAPEGEDNGMPSDEELDSMLNEPQDPSEEVSKSVKIEYYNLEK